MNLLQKLRKPYLSILLAALVITPTLTSCSIDNDESKIENQTVDMSKHLIDFDELKVMAENVKSIYLNNKLSRVSEDVTEQQIKIALKPLTDNGMEIRNELINTIDFTDEELNEVSNLDDKQLAELSLAFNSIQGKADWSTQDVVNCLGVALGLNEIWGLIDNTAQLATVQGTKKLLKLLAKRYLGWIGVAIAAYTFGDCMDAW
ncbi:hypothetical protein [Olleya marilimosa]|uniref:hypothetical protein n=1 Tax=Olleya marilimosa TaxID=272164 RepID=UPI000487DBAB|nr:hypothetical protein [Olleya marilimosa]